MSQDADSGASAPATIEDLQHTLTELRRFVARRFDEVSFEVNATGQMLGMTEEMMAARFTEVMTLLNAVVFKGDGRTPHNVGVELEAVVKTTEDAANKILNSAMAITDMTRQNIDWTDVEARQRFLDGLNAQADTILAACAFQDLTGQRIARTLENIRKAEAELADTLRRMGLKIDITPAQAAQTLGGDNTVHSQADIDKIFA